MGELGMGETVPRNAISTAQAPGLVQHAMASRWAGAVESPAVRAAIRVLGDVAIIAITMVLAGLVAIMLFAPMLP